MTGLLEQTLGFAWGCKTQENLSPKRKIRTKCRLQKNMCRGTIRPKRDPKKYHRRTGQWVHEVQTAFQGKCHTEQEGSSG